jgi:hypothetical protein
MEIYKKNSIIGEVQWKQPQRPLPQQNLEENKNAIENYQN